jgi:CBS domain-containing protein
MIIEEVMTTDVEYIPSDMSLAEAAQCMKKRDCGFLPLGDDPNGKLQGVVTDRDIVMRGVAEGKAPDSTPVSEIKTDKVLYCFKGDDIRDAAYSMRDKQVYRLIVLDSPSNKKLCGIVSLGDILRRGEDGNIELAGETALGIKKVA